MTISFNETDGFAKDFKRLAKKYRSLPNDLLEFKKVVTALPLGSGKHFAVLRNSGEVIIIKARLFCQNLRGSSLRIIYAHKASSGAIDFIELYFKGEQANEDRGRINVYLKRG